MSQNSEKIVGSIVTPLQFLVDNDKMKAVIDEVVADALEEHGGDKDAVHSKVVDDVNRRMDEFIWFKMGDPIAVSEACDAG